MSRKRQTAPNRSTDPLDYQRVARAVAAMPKDFASGFEVLPHVHERAQLIYATVGAMRVSTDDGMWMVPPQRALWMPAGVRHSIVMLSDLTMRTLYLREDAAAFMPEVCRVLPVSPLLRELIVRATELPLDYDEDGPAGHVVALDHRRTARPAVPAPAAADAERSRGCARFARRCSMRRATSARWMNGRRRSTPAPAPWRGISRAKPAFPSVPGASRRACWRRWAGWGTAPQ